MNNRLDKWRAGLFSAYPNFSSPYWRALPLGRMKKPLMGYSSRAFNLHSVSISNTGAAIVKRGGIGMSCVAAEQMTNVTCLRIAADERLSAVSN